MHDRIGRFAVERKLGEGGMGVVYAAHDHELGRTVAIKTLPHTSTDPAARERIRREARAAAAVSHPNVCHVYEVGEADGTIYIAMELLEGEPLSARIARGPLSAGEAVPIATGILSALDALHGRGIVHRDLKPANVFLTPHGVKLLDFGLALGTAGDAALLDVSVTATGTVTGTPRYMAPEQLQRRPVGSAADQFAFGAVLFEMLTGRPAFTGNTVFEVAHAVLHDQAPALAGGADAAALDRIIRRCLAKSPAERYPDVASLTRDLHAAGARTETGDVPVIQATTRLAVLPFRLLRQDADIEFLSFGLADALVVSLSGLGTLVVRSSQVAQRFAGESLDLQRLATEAEVDAVLTGSLLRGGDQVRVVVQLLQAPGGAVLWSHTAQVAMGDVFQLQDDLTRQIVASLAIPLSAHDRRRLGRDVPANGRASELYLKANHLAHGALSETRLLAARELYQASLAADPDYAPAWARLGRVQRVLAKYSLHRDEDSVRQSASAFERAFALNPDLPLAHHLYTSLEIEELGRGQEAMERLLLRARRAQNDPDLFAGLTLACRYCGLLEASLAADVRARQLDPALGTSVQYTHLLLADLEGAQRHDDPGSPFVTVMLRLERGEAELAGQVLQRFQLDSALMVERLFVDTLAAAIRDDADAVETLAQRIRASGFRDPEGLAALAILLAAVRRPLAALDMLEETVARGYCCPQLRNQTWLAGLAGGERFERIIAQAEEGRRRAEQAFVAADGPRLLGMLPV